MARTGPRRGHRGQPARLWLVQHRQERIAQERKCAAGYDAPGHRRWLLNQTHQKWAATRSLGLEHLFQRERERSDVDKNLFALAGEFSHGPLFRGVELVTDHG
jgi:hypothetical protein